MCLSRVVKYKTKPKYGYKCFGTYDKHLVPECTERTNSDGTWIFYKKNKTYITRTRAGSDGKYIFITGRGKYRAGYHCFTTLRAAKAWRQGDRRVVIYKVKISDIVAQGIQNGSRVVVAQQMQLIKKVKI